MNTPSKSSISDISVTDLLAFSLEIADKTERAKLPGRPTGDVPVFAVQAPKPEETVLNTLRATVATLDLCARFNIDWKAAAVVMDSYDLRLTGGSRVYVPAQSRLLPLHDVIKSTTGDLGAEMDSKELMLIVAMTLELELKRIEKGVDKFDKAGMAQLYKELEEEVLGEAANDNAEGGDLLN